MSDHETEPNFLRRWSQRKHAAAREGRTAPTPAVDAPVAPAAGAGEPARALVAATDTAAENAPPAVGNATTPAPARDAPAPLPDIASLTFDSDFRAFLAPEVEETTRRAALHKLFADPRFNVQDGLDTYIADYSKFEPVTPEILKQLQHVRYLFDPPKTRVNEHGHVEDVVDEPAPADADAAAAPASDADTPAVSDDGAPVADDSAAPHLPLQDEASSASQIALDGEAAALPSAPPEATIVPADPASRLPVEPVLPPSTR